MSTRRLLVTGASGFIGSRLVAQALDRGWSVLVLRHPDDAAPRMQSWLARTSVLVGSIGEVDKLLPGIAQWGPTACVHLAWTTTPGVYLTSRENLDWLSWSGRLIAKLAACGCEYALCVGTCAEYDSRRGYFLEDSPLSPDTLYAACKASLRMVAKQIAAQDGLGLGWARIFYLYGPGEHEKRLVPDCIRTLTTGRRFGATLGTQVRDFLHVDDVAAGLLTMLESGHQGDINICSGQPTTVRTVVETIGRTLGRLELVDFGVRSSDSWNPPVLFGANERLRQLGWQPKYSLDTGIEATVRWWQKHASICD